jgi:hypothetical protein
MTYLNYSYCYPNALSIAAPINLNDGVDGPGCPASQYPIGGSISVNPTAWNSW